jgi:hypothetical protein
LRLFEIVGRNLVFAEASIAYSRVDMGRNSRQTNPKGCYGVVPPASIGGGLPIVVRVIATRKHAEALY